MGESKRLQHEPAPASLKAHLWTKKQVAEERAYRVAERLGVLLGPDPATDSAIELAGAEVREWEREMGFEPATAEQQAGQMTFGL